MKQPHPVSLILPVLWMLVHGEYRVQCTEYTGERDPLSREHGLTLFARQVRVEDVIG